MAFIRSAVRLSNLAKVSQYVDKLADLGKRNLLFRVDVRHLYSIWQLCKSQEEYKLGLIAVNHFYNFGRQLSPEGVNKLFTFSMRCGEYQESIKLLQGACDWLQKPPDIELVYTLIYALISQRDYESVKRVFQAARSSWQLPLTDTLYALCIESMLCLKQNPLEEALMVYCDSGVMGISLPEKIHSILLEQVEEKSGSNQEDGRRYSCIADAIRLRLAQECRYR